MRPTNSVLYGSEVAALLFMGSPVIVLVGVVVVVVVECFFLLPDREAQQERDGQEQLA